MLKQEETKKIYDFVKVKPRTIQEISELLKKNWRTADRYVSQIEEETGAISTRVFREGTRGALKIVFWNMIEDLHSSNAQQEIFDHVMNKAMDKTDFSPFDIYQHIDKKQKSILIEDATKMDPEIEISEKQDFIGLLRQASKHVLMFSGNLSWVNAKQGNTKIIDIVRELIERGVSIKIIARVSFVGINNVKKILALNKEIGKDLIEVHHKYQPLRGIIIDNKIVRLREVKDPEYYKQEELKKRIGIFYDIYDKEWIEWLIKMFWKLFSSTVSAEKRIKEIELVRNEIG